MRDFLDAETRTRAWTSDVDVAALGHAEIGAKRRYQWCKRSAGAGSSWGIRCGKVALDDSPERGLVEAWRDLRTADGQRHDGTGEGDGAPRTRRSGSSSGDAELLEHGGGDDADGVGGSFGFFLIRRGFSIFDFLPIFRFFCSGERLGVCGACRGLGRGFFGDEGFVAVWLLIVFFGLLRLGSG